MFTTTFHETTSATPEQYVAGLTDFGPGRAELGNSADSYLEVHRLGTTDADVTEGGARCSRARRPRSKPGAAEASRSWS